MATEWADIIAVVAPPAFAWAVLNQGLSLMGYRDERLGKSLVFVATILFAVYLVAISWGWREGVAVEMGAWLAGIGLLVLIVALGISRRKAKQRNGEVAIALRTHIEELDRLVSQVIQDSASISNPLSPAFRELAERLLNPWKDEVVDYLDANISYEVAMQFHKITTRDGVGSNQPGGHLEKSHRFHRDFLEKLQARSARGALTVKSAPKPSGNHVPGVYSFIYREPKP